MIATVTVRRRASTTSSCSPSRSSASGCARRCIRFRFAAKCEIELEEHISSVVVGEDATDGTIPNRDYGVPAYETIDEARREAEPIDDDELELLRIRAATPRMGAEIDDRVLPAEAGLEERAISFTKGCYPGQEPMARLHYRGHVNRKLRVLELEGDVEPGAEIAYDGKVVGRVTSAAQRHALGYVRTEVPDNAQLAIGAVRALFCV